MFINKQNFVYQVDKQSLIDFFERIEDLNEIAEDVNNLLKNQNISSICEVGKILLI